MKTDYYVARCKECGNFLTDMHRPNQFLLGHPFHTTHNLNDAWIVSRTNWKYIEMAIAEMSCCGDWERVCISLERDEDYE